MSFTAIALLLAAVGFVEPGVTQQTPASPPPAKSETAQRAPAGSAPAKASTPGQQVSPTPAPKPATKPATADDNPFPEEQSQAAQKQATSDDRADRAAASAGSAQPGAAAEGSSSRDKLAGMDILGERDSRISNGAGGTIVDAKLSVQDLKVGQQYFGMGNYQGAYERFKEACLVNPDNVEAVFYLAEAARRTAHLDESAENYKLYLAAQPSGARAKQARKALAQLEGK